MIEIPLSKQGKHAGKYVAIVDDEDKDLLNIAWFVDIKTTNYAWSRKQREKKVTRLYLHRVILERKLGRPLDKGELVDHINRDGLDNRRENLRVATHSLNRGNTNLRADNKTGYRGVVKRGNKYQAAIQFNKQVFHLGYFNTAKEAYDKYCEKARELFGEFYNEI